jgi:hypothetical protein
MSHSRFFSTTWGRSQVRITRLIESTPMETLSQVTVNGQRRRNIQNTREKASSGYYTPPLFCSLLFGLSGPCGLSHVRSQLFHPLGLAVLLGNRNVTLRASIKMCHWPLIRPFVVPWLSTCCLGARIDDAAPPIHLPAKQSARHGSVGFLAWQTGARKPFSAS